MRLLEIIDEKKWIGVALVAAAAILPYILLPGAPLLYDASLAILENKVVQEGTLGELFTSDFWGTPLDASHSTGSYRPVVTATYLVQARLLGNSPAMFHITDMLLHAMSAALLLVLLRSIRLSQPWQVPAALLFAVHPVLTEAVCSAVGRADLLAGIALLAALILHLEASGRRRPWLWEGGALLAITVGILCKEYAVVFPLVLLVTGAASRSSGTISRADRKHQLFTWVLGFVLLCSYVALRRILIGTVAGVPMLGVNDHPLFGEPLLVRWSTASWLLVHSARLLLLPIGLNYHYDFGSLSIIRSLFDWRALAGMGMLAVGIFATLHALRRHKAVAPLVALVLFTFPLAPSLHTVTVSGMLFAERWLYIPAAGLAVAACWTAERIGAHRPFRKYVLACMLMLAAGSGIGTAARVSDWFSLEKLARATLKRYPDSPAVLLHLATVLGEQGRCGEAVASFEKSLELQPGKAWSWKNYAACLTRLGRHLEAAEAWRKVVELAPGEAGVLWKGLGQAEIRAGRVQDAIGPLERAYSLLPEDTGCLLELAQAHLMAANPQEAARLLRAHMALHPENGGAVETLLGNALLRQGQSSLAGGDRKEAIALAREAVDLESLPPEGLYFAGLLAARAGERELSGMWLGRALERDPDILQRKYETAVAHEESGRYLAAADSIREILAARPEDASMLFNLGRLMILAGRPEDALLPLRAGLQIEENQRARTLLREAIRAAAAKRK